MLKTIVISSLAALSLAACSPSAPDIDVSAGHDFGTVAKGKLAVVDLPVRNIGDGALTVFSVSTSCGCTKATLTPMVVPPGTDANLHIVYDSAAHPSDMGLIERHIFIASDDPDEADVKIEFRVVVKQGAS
jgi:hypothetical protein